MSGEVTDPAILAQLNGGQEVTDPAVLSQLNGSPTEDASADSNIAQANPYTTWLKNNIGVPVARAGINAVTALPFMAMDMGVAARNVGGNLYNQSVGNPATPNYELPSNILRQAMQQYLPAPTTTSGKIGEVANSMIMGGAAAYSGVPGLTSPTYNPGNVPSNFVSKAGGEGITSGQRDALAAGEDMGFQATPGQRTGSPFLQRIEARMESVPWMSHAFDRLKAGNRNLIGETASASIGEQGLPDTSTLGSAYGRLGAAYESMKDPSTVTLVNPKDASAAIDSAENSVLGQLNGNSTLRDNPLVKMVEKTLQAGQESAPHNDGYYLPGSQTRPIFDDPRLAAAAKIQYGFTDTPAGGSPVGSPVTGEQLGTWSSKLGAAAFQHRRGATPDIPLSDGLYRVKNYVDSLWRSTMSPETAAQFDTVNSQYHNLMILAKPNVLNPVTGAVSGPNLANNLFRADKSGFAFGRNSSDLYEAARFTKAFPSMVGDSGTATRSEGLVKSLLFGIPGNAASAAYLHGGNALLQSLPPTSAGGLQPAMQGFTSGLPGLSGQIADYFK
jgi:hypothetical protein